MKRGRAGIAGAAKLGDVHEGAAEMPTRRHLVHTHFAGDRAKKEGAQYLNLGTTGIGPRTDERWGRPHAIRVKNALQNIRLRV